MSERTNEGKQAGRRAVEFEQSQNSGEQNEHVVRTGEFRKERPTAA